MTNGFFVGIEIETELLYKNADKKQYKYDPELHSIMSVFSDISESLCERGVKFTLRTGNFDHPTFPIEFCIFLEEFCDLSSFTTNTKINEYELWFYEQGFNYRLAFKNVDKESYLLSVTDDNTPGVAPIVINGSRLELHLILVTFYQRVTFLISTLCPAIVKNDMYIE